MRLQPVFLQVTSRWQLATAVQLPVRVNSCNWTLKHYAVVVVNTPEVPRRSHGDDHQSTMCMRAVVAVGHMVGGEVGVTEKLVHQEIGENLTKLYLPLSCM